MEEAQLVIYFASPSAIAAHDVDAILRDRYKGAVLIGCSTGGEIAGADVLDDAISGTAIRFETTRFSLAKADIPASRDIVGLGQNLAGQLPAEGLRAVFVLSDGLLVNGSDLVDGLTAILPPDVVITGGLAGDGSAFGTTWIGADGPMRSGQAVLLGLYGDDLVIGTGCHGGWHPFGPERTITKSDGNILYELDGQPAFDLYCRYIGCTEQDFTLAAALTHPLTLVADGKDPVVRTVLSCDVDARSLTFAGDVPQGHACRLMTANFDDLADGAAEAARDASLADVKGDQLALLVSCIGRKLMMGSYVDDETDAVIGNLPIGTHVAGFYSYGEIAPGAATGQCSMHNQTMTITTLAER